MGRGGLVDTGRRRRNARELSQPRTAVCGLARCGDALRQMGFVPAATHRELGPRRIQLIGDAAHAMLPNAGQGAAQAFEDAYILARWLAAAPAEPASCHGEFRRIRIPRVHAVQRARRPLCAPSMITTRDGQISRGQRLTPSMPWRGSGVTMRSRRGTAIRWCRLGRKDRWIAEEDDLSAGNAHVAREPRPPVAPIDDKVVALRLARDGFVDRILERLVALRGAQRLAEVGRVGLTEAHVESAGAGDPHAVARLCRNCA